jgi:uncharacterized YkwD family protein
MWALLLVSGCGKDDRDRDASQMKAKAVKPFNVSSVDTELPSNKHVVQNQESLKDIAERYHVNLDDLLAQNPGLAQDGSGSAAPNTQTNVPQESLESPINQGQTVTIPENESLTGYEEQVLALTNKERQKAGLSPCAGSDSNLNRSARAKSEDMAANNYFSHDSPTYGDPFAMMRNFGVQYQSAGENIAMGQPTPQEVVTAWMNSEGHRKNILNGAFTYLGVGYVLKDGKAYWTQQFIGK